MAEKEEVKKTEKYYKDLVKAKIDVEDKHIEGIAAQNPDFLKNIASHHDLHPELQKVLAGSSDNGVTEALSLNPNATTETLDILSRSNNPNVLHNVGKHPNAHKETQIKLYHHPSVGYDDPSSRKILRIHSNLSNFNGSVPAVLCSFISFIISSIESDDTPTVVINDLRIGTVIPRFNKNLDVI